VIWKNQAAWNKEHKNHQNGEDAMLEERILRANSRSLMMLLVVLVARPIDTMHPAGFFVLE